MMSLLKARDWYAIQVKGRRELQVSQALLTRGYEVFMPLYTVKKTWSDRNKTVKVPLLPSYTFCRFDPQVQFTIVSTPGVARVVGFGKGPTPVDDDEIASLMILASSGVRCEPHSFVRAGEEVEIVSGPLTGVKGIVVSTGRRARVVISVQLVQSSAVVEVDEACLVSASGRSYQYLQAS